MWSRVAQASKDKSSNRNTLDIVKSFCHFRHSILILFDYFVISLAVCKTTIMIYSKFRGTPAELINKSLTANLAFIKKTFAPTPAKTNQHLRLNHKLWHVTPFSRLPPTRRLQDRFSTSRPHGRLDGSRNSGLTVCVTCRRVWQVTLE